MCKLHRFLFRIARLREAQLFRFVSIDENCDSDLHCEVLRCMQSKHCLRLRVCLRARVCAYYYLAMIWRCFIHSAVSPIRFERQARLHACRKSKDCTGISNGNDGALTYRRYDASLRLTRIFPRLAFDWPRPYFSVPFSPFPPPFLPFGHPTLAWLRIFTILRGKIRLFLQAVSMRLRTERDRIFFFYYLSES